MRLAGLQKLTLLDYPGEVACTVFTRGCNLRCPFCQNPELVLPELFCEGGDLPEEEFFEFLDRRKGRLSAVAVTGGEPTIHQDLPLFLSRIRERGYLVKLDTNGLNPEMLSEILNAKLADYVAMDVKNSPGKYAMTCGIEEPDTVRKCESEGRSSFDYGIGIRTDIVKNKIWSTEENAGAEESASGLWERAEKSISLLKESSVKGEFRTTVAAGLHTVEDMREIAGYLAGPGPWYLQQFREGVEGGSLVGTFNRSGLHLASPSWKELDGMKKAVQDLVPNTSLRGI